MAMQTRGLTTPHNFTEAAEDHVIVSSFGEQSHISFGVVFFFICFLAGMMGNSLVLFIYLCVIREGHTRPLAIALATFDLCMCALVIPGQVWLLMGGTKDDHRLNTGCRIVMGLQMFFLAADLWIVAVLPYERLHHIWRAFSQDFMEFKKTLGNIVAAVSLGVLLATPAVQVSGIATRTVLYGDDKLKKVSKKVGICSIAEGASDGFLPFIYYTAVAILLIGVVCFVTGANLYSGFLVGKFRIMDHDSESHHDVVSFAAGARTYDTDTGRSLSFGEPEISAEPPVFGCPCYDSADDSTSCPRRRSCSCWQSFSCCKPIAVEDDRFSSSNRTPSSGHSTIYHVFSQSQIGNGGKRTSHDFEVFEMSPSSASAVPKSAVGSQEGSRLDVMLRAPPGQDAISKQGTVSPKSNVESSQLHPPGTDNADKQLIDRLRQLDESETSPSPSSASPGRSSLSSQWPSKSSVSFSTDRASSHLDSLEKVRSPYLSGSIENRNRRRESLDSEMVNLAARTTWVLARLAIFVAISLMPYAMYMVVLTTQVDLTDAMLKGQYSFLPQFSMVSIFLSAAFNPYFYFLTDSRVRKKVGNAFTVASARRNTRSSVSASSRTLTLRSAQFRGPYSHRQHRTPVSQGETSTVTSVKWTASFQRGWESKSGVENASSELTPVG